MNSIDAERFEEYRPLMFSIAYRMLGSITEAEDIVQDAYLRYQAASPERIVSHKAPEVGVDDEDRVAARTLQLELAFQLGHTRYSTGSSFAGSVVRRFGIEPAHPRTLEPAHHR